MPGLPALTGPSGLPPELARHDWEPPFNFLGLSADESAWSDASIVILPVPLEATTSWGAGTRDGPAAILEASRYVELYDEELEAEPAVAGICTLPAVDLPRGNVEAALRALRALYEDLLRVAKTRWVVALGGEHSISWAPAVVWADRLDGALSVLQLDAHSDLRPSYHGTPWSHACVMRRILEGAPDVRATAVGVRAQTAGEAEFMRARGVTTVFSHQMREEDWIDRVLDGLGEDVYLTFDVDFFDPAIVPATGTPEPAGGDWWSAMELLRRVFRERRVVGADVVELAPRRGQEASAFLAAKLVYKLIGLHVTGLRAGPEAPT